MLAPKSSGPESILFFFFINSDISQYRDKITIIYFPEVFTRGYAVISIDHKNVLLPVQQLTVSALKWNAESLVKYPTTPSQEKLHVHNDPIKSISFQYQCLFINLFSTISLQNMTV